MKTRFIGSLWMYETRCQFGFRKMGMRYWRLLSQVLKAGQGMPGSDTSDVLRRHCQGSAGCLPEFLPAIRTALEMDHGGQTNVKGPWGHTRRCSGVYRSGPEREKSTQAWEEAASAQKAMLNR